MKVLRGTLTFVLGMIIGIILFVVAIGGTVAILATSVTVGNLQSSITSTEVISPDSELYDKTILDAVQGVMKDVQNFDKLSLKTLYEHYGIKLLNGISGIDFTDKAFYSVPIPDLVNDLSIVVNSFTLNDIGKIAGVDFSKYNLPVLTDNLNNSISTAVDSILGSLNGDLSIRAIKDKIGIDFGVEDNKLMAVLQDVSLSEFGNVINVLRVDNLLEADTDTFIILNGTGPKFYVATDEFVQYELGIGNDEQEEDSIYETSLIGGKDTDGDGTADKANEVNTLYVKKTVVVDGEETEKYVVDLNALENNPDGTDVFRRLLYKSVNPEDVAPDTELYVICYANRVDTITENSIQINDGDPVTFYDFTALGKGLFPVSELDFNDNSVWSVIDPSIDKDSKMQIVEGATDRTKYQRVHVGESAAILQTIAHLTINELQHMDNLLDNLTVRDVIELTPNTARIMKSLYERNCKILELGEVANELTLGEMVDITNYAYEESNVGKYVRIIDDTSFILYDPSNPAYAGAQRYTKNSDGTFTPSANGKYVNSFYYTLYNPALHEGSVRYKRLADDGTASSALLQRFVGLTLGDFSQAFDELMLADVLEIDADIYAKTDLEYIRNHDDERFFYFDTEKSVYRVANDDYIAENESETYYRIAQSGDSASFMKKLAYVKIDKMSSAMEVIIDDMMLSEFIDVYTESAVSLGTFNAVALGDTGYIAGNFDENASYFVDYATNENHIDDAGVKYVYVYDVYGDYAKANFQPKLITENIEESAIYYTYKPYNTLGSTPAEVLANSVPYTAKGNLYYFDNKTKEYTRNMVLCTYMLTHTESTQSSLIPQLSGKYLDKIFYREAVDGKSDADVDNQTVFKGTVYTYTGATLEHGIVVRDNFQGYLSHIENEPAFADMPLYTFEKSSSGNPTFIVNRTDVQKLATALKGHGFKSTGVYTDPDTGEQHDSGLFYARRQCENVYVEKADGEYVFVDGQYVPYDSEIHSSDLQRFDRRLGYIGYISEVSFLSGDTRVTEFDIKPVTYIREKSSPVLRMLARGTVGEMSKIINNATIGDIIDAEPGSLFDNAILKSAKLSELGSVFSDLLTNMTIGDLIVWSHVTDVNEYVRIALENVSLQKLISSMILDEKTHEIKLDMLKLYGYNY